MTFHREASAFKVHEVEEVEDHPFLFGHAGRGVA
jgi:hypothetical protein